MNKTKFRSLVLLPLYILIAQVAHGLSSHEVERKYELLLDNTNGDSIEKFVASDGFLLKMGSALYFSTLSNKDDNKIPNFSYKWQSGYGILCGAILKGKKFRPTIDFIWERFKVGYSGNFTNKWCYDPPDTDSCYYEDVVFEGYNEIDRYGINIGLSTIRKVGKQVLYFNGGLALRRMRWFDPQIDDTSYTLGFIGNERKVIRSGGEYYFASNQLGIRLEASLVKRLGHIHFKIGPSVQWYFSDFENKEFTNFIFPVGSFPSNPDRNSKTTIFMVGFILDFILSNTF
jgi:hypothetical protein